MDSKMKYYFGIDFGTTNSALCGYGLKDNTKFFFKYGDEDERPIPSTVAIDEHGNIYTGRDAWNKRNQLRERCKYFHSIKTVLDSDETYTIAGKLWTTTDIASEIFKHLKSKVKEKNNIEMTAALVSIPIGFNSIKRAKLRQAATIAGIDITAFVSEPTAAFFANYETLKSSSQVAIFDWGGGTLDVAVIRHANGKIFELATGGMNIAGDDIDQKIARRIHEKINRKKKLNIAFDDMPSIAKDNIIMRAERAKIDLSDEDENEATVSINQYGEYGVCREILDYEWFKDIIAPEVTKAIECLDNTIKKSEVGIANIDKIVMVGGSSNLRPLIEKMQEKYGDKLFFPEETMWNVGEGAAMLAMSPGEYCANQSIGIILSNSEYYELLSCGDSIKNWQRRCNFGVVDTTEQARFVFATKGETAGAKISTEGLQTLELPNYKFLQEQIAVTATIDSNMIFRVDAKSNMQPEKYRRVWEYDKLKFYYLLPAR